uniref:Uncharacterized protein n=1 Tax=Nymphaea colorata TaxID=210225 RepID=A0A5K0Z8T6_9MAGN
MRPSLYPEGMAVRESHDSSGKHCQVRKMSGSCPDGTVPILRRTMLLSEEHQNFYTYASKSFIGKHSITIFNPNSTRSLPLLNASHKVKHVS